MRISAHSRICLAAAVLLAVQPWWSLFGDEAGQAVARPKTVREMFTAMGDVPRGFKQLKLTLEGKIEGEELGKLPREMRIDLRYDKAANQVLVVNNSSYPDGRKARVTTYSNQRRALIWTERMEAEADPEAEPDLAVKLVDPGLTLPNPWRLPERLAFPALFADALHGYESFAREYSRSRPLNFEPDERGLVWFDLRPSPGAGAAMRLEFNAGLKVEAGFAADGGWLKEMRFRFPEPEATMTLRVVEQSTELTKEDRAGFGFPEHVVAEAKKTPRPEVDPPAEPAVEPEQVAPGNGGSGGRRIPPTRPGEEPE